MGCGALHPGPPGPGGANGRMADHEVVRSVHGQTKRNGQKISAPEKAQTISAARARRSTAAAGSERARGGLGTSAGALASWNGFIVRGVPTRS
jgi:hypothetical protein